MFSFTGEKGGSSSFKTKPDTLRSNDSFEMLLGLGSGRWKGLTKGLQSLEVNGVPLENSDGSSNFKDFAVIFADGDPATKQIVNFKLGGGGGTTQVNTEIGNNNASGAGPWVVASTSTPNADFIDLRLAIQSLYQQDKNGVRGTTMTLEIEMRPSGTDNWINPLSSNASPTYNPNGFKVDDVYRVYLQKQAWNSNGTGWNDPNPGYLKITDKTTSMAIKELRIAVPNTGSYANKTWQVRIRLIEKELIQRDDQYEERRAVTFESIAAVTKRTFGDSEAWRGLAWLQVVGKASDQLSGVPELRGVYDTAIVKVPPTNVFNPDTRQYTGALWDGSYVLSYTNDPAWGLKHLIEDPISGIAALSPGATLDKWDVLEASKYFSQLVPDGKGGMHPRFSMNLKIDQAQSAEETIQFVAGAVNAIAWDIGDGKWRMKVNKPETPTAIFTRDNIYGEFTYQHTDVDSRYNDYTVSFLNEDNKFQEDRARVYDQAHIDRYGRKPTTIVAVGATNRQEALRRAMFRMRTSTREDRIVNFVTNRQGSLVQPLSTILIADTDLAYVGDEESDLNRTTSRISSINGTTINLGSTIRLEAGVTYDLVATIPNPNYAPNSASQPTHPDWDKPTVTVKRRITNTTAERGTVSVIRLAEAFPASVDINAPVALSAPSLPSLPVMYLVMEVKPEGNDQITISALIVDVDKWDAADNVNEAAILGQISSSEVPAPTAPDDMFVLRSFETDFQTKRVLTVSWDRPGSLFLEGFKVDYSLNSGPWISLANTTQESTVEIQQPENGLYTFRIIAKDRRGRESPPLIKTFEVDENPSDYGALTRSGPLADIPTKGRARGERYTTTDQNPNRTYVWDDTQWVLESNYVDKADQIEYNNGGTVEDWKPADKGATEGAPVGTNVGNRPVEEVLSELDKALLIDSRVTEIKNDVERELADTAAEVDQARTDIANARSELTTATNQAKADASAARTEVSTVRNDLATEVQRAKDDTASIRTVQEQVQRDVSGAVSRIGTEETNRANADSALANRLTVVEASVGNGGDINARIREEATARANADSALAVRSSALEVKFNNSGDRKLSVVTADTFVPSGVGDPATQPSVGVFGQSQYGPHVQLDITNATLRSVVPMARATQSFKLKTRLWQVAGTPTYAAWYVDYLDVNFNPIIGTVIGDWFSIDNGFLQAFDRDFTATFEEGVVWMRFSVLINRKPTNPGGEGVPGSATRVMEASVENVTIAKALNTTTNARIGVEESARANADSALAGRVDSVVTEYNNTFNNVSARIGAEETTRSNADSALASRNTTLESQMAGTAPSGLSALARAARKNLAEVDWWKAGAAIPWSKNSGREDYIFTLPSGTDWGAGGPVMGPDGSSSDVWLARADTREQEGGGWNGGGIAPLDPDKTYRFMIPMIGLGTGFVRSFFWGTVGVCTLNTTTPHNNAYFASYRTTLANEWLLFVGYVYPRNSTGKTHEGSGIWNMKTGEFLGTGSNWCFRPDGAQLNHRAYQYYATPGAYQAFGRPIIELVDGSESNFEAALKGKQAAAVANARITTEETTRASADSALAVRATTLESRVGGHNSADIVARVATEEAARASADAAISSRTTSLEAYSGKSPGLLSNPNYAKLTSRVNRSLPDYWHIWEDSATAVRQWNDYPGVESNNAYYDVVQTGQGQGIYQDVRAGAGWYVVEATIQIVDGNQLGSGVLLYGLDGNRNYVNGAAVRFGVDKPIGETPQYGVKPDGVTGYSNVLRYSKLIQLDGNNAGSRVEYVRVYAMSNYAGDGFSSSYKAILWHSCNIRRASDAEIAGKQALPIAEGAVARVAAEELARTNADSALASRTSFLEAQMTGVNDSYIFARTRNEETARANADSAISNRLNTVEASYASKSDLVAQDMDFDFDANIPADQAWAPGYHGGGTLDPRITKTVAWSNISCLYLANHGVRAEVYSRKTIPINPSLKYRMKARCGAYLTGGSGNTSRFYIGFIGLDAYGNVVDHGGYGSYRYAIVTGEAIADGQLVERSVVVTGEGNDSWLKFPPGTRQIRPLIFMNYDQNNVHSYVDYISIEEITEIDARVTEEATARAVADGALSNRTATLESQFRGDTDSPIFVRLRTEETTRANADSALATRTSSLESRAGGLESRVGITETAVSDLKTGSATARLELQAVTPGGVAQITLKSNNNSGAAVEIVGNVTFMGNLNIMSAASGGRMHITNQTIRVYDDGGNEVVTFGRLN